jgi:hypothetical protein
MGCCMCQSHHLASEILSEGKPRAVLGGWDPSARKFFKTDELSLTVPYEIFTQMVDRFEESFLTTKTWSIVQKKINRSRRTWGEEERARRGSKPKGHDLHNRYRQNSKSEYRVSDFVLRI